MFDFTKNIYKKAFVFGTGGGNDIVSAVLIALYLQRYGIETDIGGILSPAAYHTFDGELEKTINEIKGKVKRFIPYKKPVEISFIDPLLPEIIREQNVEIGRFYDLSLRYGTDKLIQDFEKLISDNGYDLVIAVDVGGDILGRSEDPTLLSPLMDFTSLYLLSKISVTNYLVEFGLGTDGELRPEGMNEIIQEIYNMTHMKAEGVILKSDPEVQKFESVYNEIKYVRKGHTATMTFKTLEHFGSTEDIISRYKYRYRIGSDKWEIPYMITLPYEYFGRVFTIHSKNFALTRKDLAFSYKNSLEQFIRIKRPTWKTELDLFYLWSGDNWTSPNDGFCMMLLTPTTLIGEFARRTILDAGFIQLEEDGVDLILILRSDYNYIPKQLNISKINTKFCLVSKEEINISIFNGLI